ncbi:DNA-directed RNA polymerase sigma-70 factor [Yeosuana aromativorans]|uniref:DNA-directed RNA polymerase sigma-70 factor n=1 Tax=Yeosuana aromativorans TaxID=288019 RepID=A0A8J3BDT4_9FLAO|nr:sigma-70 family RNA polymerase sigma factor [Yeosuana aromativorans]GGK12284.1 DNA-directed RNA polymerase sigma-70 factor [Yeosuana aromativorans]
MAFSYINNEKLIEHLKKGDESAYAYLVSTYHKKLFVYALSLNNDHATADDIVQNVFLKTWEYRNRLNPDYSISSFLYKTTYNEFINQYHKSRAISNLERSYIEALDTAIDEDNKDVMERKIACVTEGIKHLPPKCKETFLLSKKEGLTNIEISEYLNISIKTVEGQLTKAYNLLRQRVGDQLKEILFFFFGKTKQNRI